MWSNFGEKFRSPANSCIAVDQCIGKVSSILNYKICSNELLRSHSLAPNSWEMKELTLLSAFDAFRAFANQKVQVLLGNYANDSSPRVGAGDIGDMLAYICLQIPVTNGSLIVLCRIGCWVWKVASLHCVQLRGFSFQTQQTARLWNDLERKNWRTSKIPRELSYTWFDRRVGLLEQTLHGHGVVKEVVSFQRCQQLTILQQQQRLRPHSRLHHAASSLQSSTDGIDRRPSSGIK